MKHHFLPLLSLLLIQNFAGTAHAGLEAGEQINLTMRGVAAEEQQKISGIYRVGESGNIRLPMLDALVSARGLTPEQFARAAESAYKTAGIYTQPAIEVEVLQGKDLGSATVVSVGGQVRKAGEVQFRKNLTVLQAIDGAGGRSDFGGRNLFLIREGKQYCLDFTILSHKNIILRPGDSIQVDQKGVLDRWKGQDDIVKKLIE